MKFKIEIDEIVRMAAPDLKVLQIEANVENAPTCTNLSEAIDQEVQNIKNKYKIDQINKRPAIAATRKAYRALGKEPNRYRPSAEALCRRAVKDIEIYKISNLVDLINLLSLYTGYSIGGFDADKIQGEKLVLGRGKKDEEFNAIGRGPLNIEGLPVYRDNIGGIGTPTSDHERTKLTNATTNILICINIYGEETSINDTLKMTQFLLQTYASSTNIKYCIIE